MRSPSLFLTALSALTMAFHLGGCPSSKPMVRQGPVSAGPGSTRPVRRPARPDTTLVRAPAFSYPALLPRTWRRVAVDGLAYVPGRVMGAMLPMTIMVGPNGTAEPLVAIAGTMSGGMGGSWRAAAWMAAYQATAAVGRDLGDYSIQVAGKGFIDGPSAGTLMTAAMMAAMMNVPVRKDVTMTGTVNPDGTVGPVGGIPNKFRAAIKAGKKILGYPVGQRFSKEHGTNRIVDLQQLALASGCRAVEVSTIYQAFELLTGRHFPRPAPVSPQAMNLPPDTFKLLKKSIGPWFVIFKKALAAAKTYLGARSPKAKQKMTVAHSYMNSARQLFNEGAMAAAYDFAYRGGAWAYTSLWYAKLLTMVFKKDLKSIFAATGDMKKSEQAVVARLQQLRKHRPTTTDQLAALVTGYEQLIEGWSYAQQGDRLLKMGIAKIRAWAKSPRKTDPSRIIFHSFNSTIFQYAMAQVKQGKAEDFVRFHSRSTIGARVDYDRLRRTAKMFQAIAQANLTYFEQIFVPGISKAVGISVERTKLILMMKVGKYLMATYCLRFPQYVLSRKWGPDSIPTAVASVAGAMASYFNSAMLIAKYYSLNLGLGKKVSGKLGTYQTVPRLKALVAMLNHAERTARINASLARLTTGSIPVAARVFYQIGMTMKELQAPLKVKALEMFWRSSMISRLVVSVATKAVRRPIPDAAQGAVPIR